MSKYTHKFSYRDPKPEKTVLVCRFGAFGDLMQASSVFAGLKKQGYHVTLMCSRPGVDVVLHDPNIDRIMLLDKDQVPNQNLPDFWEWQAKNYDKFVNLSESVEGTFLAMPGRTAATWHPALRHEMLNHNYLEFQHKLAGVPHEPQVKFYSTLAEDKWARGERAKMGAGPIIMWSLAGSSVHKTWAGLDNILGSLMIEFPKCNVVLVGGPECVMLEAGWENEHRIIKTCGKWTIRQSLAFLPHVDLLIGPETGVLNAAACMDMWKLCFLSHSTWINLTRDWKNTLAMWSENTHCKGRGDNLAPACHLMHYGWAHCTEDKPSGTAMCQKDISVEEVWSNVFDILTNKIRSRTEVAA